MGEWSQWRVGVNEWMSKWVSGAQQIKGSNSYAHVKRMEKERSQQRSEWVSEWFGGPYYIDLLLNYTPKMVISTPKYPPCEDTHMADAARRGKGILREVWRPRFGCNKWCIHPRNPPDLSLEYSCCLLLLLGERAELHYCLTHSLTHHYLTSLIQVIHTSSEVVT